MRPELIAEIKKYLSLILRWLASALDRLTTWASQLSWWKFFLFAILLLVGGKILEEALFSSSENVVVVKKNKRGDKPA